MEALGKVGKHENRLRKRKKGWNAKRISRRLKSRVHVTRYCVRLLILSSSK